ncbi:MAG: class 1 fructose-bisphosphatase [Nitrospirota bacterium]|nr:class 1 fructose-bisphosphatase [Nitrospirota bacterium]
MDIGTTLTRFLLEEQRKFPGSTGDFTGLLADIAIAGKMICRGMSKAGLIDILGATGSSNVQGEEVQKLDVVANDTMIRALDHTGHLIGMASEEMEDIFQIPDEFPKGKYVLMYDPLDGSSNIDVNISVGTIFSILRRKSTGNKATLEDFLQPGAEQVCAGYVLYGTSTMMVYTTGTGVHGFTLDPGVGEFLLSHEDIRIPDRGDLYSINEGNARYWHKGTTDYINHLKSGAGGTSFKGRYIGSLVADFHRNLLKGGIFLYPGDTKSPDGKLRLLYEANPLAFLAEQAGGAASTGEKRILDLMPTKLHQRTPLIIGSKDNVAEAERFWAGA